MGRKKKSEGENEPLAATEPAPVSEPFAESAAPVAPVKKTRFSIPITEQGTIEWDALRAETRERLESVLKADPKVTAITSPEVAQYGGLIRESHVDGLLDLLAAVERMIVPGYVAKSSKGQFTLDPDIIQQTFRFSPEQKAPLLPAGAAAANELLPASVQQWIVRGSNVGVFFGGLAMAVREHMITAVSLQQQRNASRAPAPAKPNGQEHVAEGFAA